MFDDALGARKRLRRFVRERLEPARYRETAPVEIAAWEVPGEPVPFAEAVTAPFTPFAVGEPWGRPWGTVWFHVRGQVPASWRDRPGLRPELVVDPGFIKANPGFQAEALVFRADGTVVKAINPRNAHVPLTAAELTGGVELYLEAASNPDTNPDGTFAPSPLGALATSGQDPIYRLRRLELGLLDETVWELVADVWTLDGLAEQLPTDSPRHRTIVRGLQRMIDVIDPDDVAGTAADGRAVLAPLLERPATASAHSVVASGHAHIDSAWLWPLRETVRKCARTFSNVVALMDEDPTFVFACSSAQQLAWVRDSYPELFARIREKVREGRFVPVGGMWVESDTNMPGGEAMVRQFVEGRRFMTDELGVEPAEVWLPDSFGYSAALPQIFRSTGARWFLTQKMSWNQTNRMPHHSFRWEGLDGSGIFTHFPPSDTYNSEISGAQLARSERNFAESGVGNSSLLLFGWGDGGGGPTREMLAATRRVASLEGSPTVRVDTPESFFTAAEAELPDPPVWTGEMYLELHRGTYSAQHRTKQGNRRTEHLLREAELWAATAATRATGYVYPHDELERIWQLLLLFQFHDILPGSSIAWVYEDAERGYAEAAVALETVIAGALAALTGGDGTGPALVANAGPRAAGGVPALGVAAAAPADPAVRAERTAEGIVLDNGLVRAVLDDDGLLVSLVDAASGREAVAPGAAAGLLQCHRDTPNEWDAWDVDRHYLNRQVDLRRADSVALDEEIGADGAAVRIVRTTGASTIVQTVRLRPGSAALDFELDVQWCERQKLLKLAFPLDLRAEYSSSETQFGHVRRPTYVNTSWDWARFEVCAHRFVHVGEPDYGVAVANSSTYGHDIARTVRGDGGSTTTVRLTLLRSPLYPDPEADQGRHLITLSVRPGADLRAAVEEGYRLNLPTRTVTGTPVAPLLTVDNPAVVVESVKLAHDRSGDLVVRLYESEGCRQDAVVAFADPAAGIEVVDLLERTAAAGGAPSALAVPVRVDDDGVRLTLRPFQVVTLRVPRRG
jgi:alpha-mannosidase